MPKGETQVTRQQVLAVIVAGGAAGITRKGLIEKFSRRCTEQCIDMHITALNRQQPPVIFKPKLGVMVGIEHKPADACHQDSTKSETQATLTATGDTQSNVEGTHRIAYDWVKGPVTHDIHGTSLDVHHHDAADLPPASLAQQMAQIGGFIPTIVEDINVADPKDVEFAIYSSGCMDMHFTDLSVTLQPPVLAKLRGFLGLFQEAV